VRKIKKECAEISEIESILRAIIIFVRSELIVSSNGKQGQTAMKKAIAYNGLSEAGTCMEKGICGNKDEQREGWHLRRR
jgi:hypothetical protein